MLTKSTTTVVDCQGTLTERYAPSGYVSSSLIMPGRKLSLPNTITYEEGSRYIGIDTRRPRWKACTHEGTIMTCGKATINASAWGWTTHIVSYPFSSTFYPGSIPPPSSAAAPSDGAVINAFWSEAKGQISSQNLLPLTDLLSLRSASKTIIKLGEDCMDFKRFMQAKPQVKDLYYWFYHRRSAPPRKGRRKSTKQEDRALAQYFWKNASWRDIVGHEIGLDLALKFGARPLADSISEMTNLVMPLGEYYNKLQYRNRNGVLPFKVSVPSATSKTSERSRIIMSDGVFGNYTLKIGCTKTLHCSAETSYRTNDVEGFRAIADAAGFTSFFSTVWDCLPYSFVADFWTNFSGFAKDLDRYFTHAVPLEKITNISDVWITDSRYSQVEFKSIDYYDQTGIPFTGGWKTIVFNRYQIPQPDDFLHIPITWNSGLNFQRSVTGAQLLMQRVL